MRREFHVRFCERAAVEFLRATHPIFLEEHGQRTMRAMIVHLAYY